MEHNQYKNMEKIIEVINSINDETAKDLEGIKNTLQSEADALLKTKGKLYARAKTAEGFNYDKTAGKWLKIKEAKKTTPAADNSPQSNEPDYAKLAFLEAKGITHSDDQKIIQEEAARLILPLTDVLNMEHIKTKLKDRKDQREVQANLPKGRGSGGGGANPQDVNYWLEKGETPDDQELAEKVIAARITKEKNVNKFSDTLYTG